MFTRIITTAIFALTLTTACGGSEPPPPRDPPIYRDPRPGYDTAASGARTVDCTGDFSWAAWRCGPGTSCVDNPKDDCDPAAGDVGCQRICIDNRKL